MRTFFTALVAVITVLLLFFLSPLLQEAAHRLRRKAYQWQLGLLARTMGATMFPAGTAFAVLDRPAGHHFTGSFTLDPGSIAAGAREQETVALVGAQVGDVLIVRNRTNPIGLIVSAERVTAPNAVEFYLENNTAGALDQAASTYDFALIRGSTGPLR